MGLGAFREKLTGELSTGSRRIVDLACILAQDPKVLMLDEPSAGVAQKETEALGPLLLRVREHTGCSVLVIEHDMPLLSSICDEMIALELGGIIAQGTPDEVLEHPAVIESYLGTDEQVIRRSGTQARTPEADAGYCSGAEADVDHDAALARRLGAVHGRVGRGHRLSAPDQTPMAMPTLAPTSTCSVPMRNGSSSVASRRRPSSSGGRPSRPSTTTPNSSPPSRARVSAGRTHACSRSATPASTMSPTMWP